MRMRLNAEDLSRWVKAQQELFAALVAEGVEVVDLVDTLDNDRESFLVFEQILQVIGMPGAVVPNDMEDEILWDRDESDRVLVSDLGDLFAEFPDLLTSSHPPVVRYRQAISSIEEDRQIRDTLEGQ